MRRSVILVFLFVGLCTIDLVQGNEAATETPMSAEALRKAGDGALDYRRYEEAINKFSQAAELEPDNYINYLKRATAYQLKRRPLSAIKDYSKILELRPNHWKSLHYRGKCYLRLGSFTKAIEDLRKTTLEDPKNNDAQKDLQKALQFQNMYATFQQKKESDPQTSINLINEMLTTCTESDDLYTSRAKLYLALSDYDSALSDSTNAIKINQNNVEAYIVRGTVSVILGDIKSARSFLKQGLKFDPENRPLKAELKKIKKYEELMTLVEEKYGKGEYRQVLEDVNTALAIYPSSQLNSKLREWECKAHSELKEFKKAITACSLWHESDSNALDALLLRAEAHAQNEDFDSALRDLEKAAQLAPRDGNVRQKIQQMNNRKRIAERKDYYKVLGIPRDASVKEIRRAYRQLALEWHPDKNRDDPAKHELSEKKYQEITEAYEILTDEEKRRRYDSGEDLNQPQGHHGHPFQQGGGGPFHFNFNFGGNAGFGGF